MIWTHTACNDSTTVEYSTDIAVTDCNIFYTFLDYIHFIHYIHFFNSLYCIHITQQHTYTFHFIHYTLYVILYCILHGKLYLFNALYINSRKIYFTTFSFFSFLYFVLSLSCYIHLVIYCVIYIVGLLAKSETPAKRSMALKNPENLEKCLIVLKIGEKLKTLKNGSKSD